MSLCVRVRAPPRDARWFVLGCWPAWRGRMGTAASAGMKLNWAPVSVWLSFTLPHFPPPRPPPPPKPSPLSSCCSRRLLRLHPHRNLSVPADPPQFLPHHLRISQRDGLVVAASRLSALLVFIILSNAHGPMAPQRVGCDVHASTHARQTSDADALSHHSAGAHTLVHAQA